MDSLNPCALPQLDGMFLKIYSTECYDNCLNGSTLASSPMGRKDMRFSVLVGPSDPFMPNLCLKPSRCHWINAHYLALPLPDAVY
jgi:hypothetical protein